MKKGAKTYGFIADPDVAEAIEWAASEMGVPYSAFINQVMRLGVQPYMARLEDRAMELAVKTKEPKPPTS